jgi:heme A synthase
MLHRAIAGVFLVFATVAAYWAAGATGRVRAASLSAFAFVLVQIGLGIANVVWALPTPLREAHAANAGITFLAYVTAFVLATLDGTSRAQLPGRLRPAQPAASTLPSRS